MQANLDSYKNLGIKYYKCISPDRFGPNIGARKLSQLNSNSGGLCGISFSQPYSILGVDFSKTKIIEKKLACKVILTGYNGFNNLEDTYIFIDSFDKQKYTFQEISESEAKAIHKKLWDYVEYIYLPKEHNDILLSDDYDRFRISKGDKIFVYWATERGPGYSVGKEVQVSKPDFKIGDDNKYLYRVYTRKIEELIRDNELQYVDEDYQTASKYGLI